MLHALVKGILLHVRFLGSFRVLCERARFGGVFLLNCTLTILLYHLLVFFDGFSKLLAAACCFPSIWREL